MQMTVGDNEDREGVRHVAEQRGFVGGRIRCGGIGCRANGLRFETAERRAFYWTAKVPPVD